MGPNGSGKSTFARALSGHPGYEVTERPASSTTARICSTWIRDERAREGVFMAFQYPVEIPGVNNAYFLKAALNATRKQHGLDELDAIDFMKRCEGEGQAAARRRVDAAALGQRGLLGRREEAQRDLPHGGARADAGACSTKPIRASTSTRCESCPHGVNAMRRPDRAFIVVTHYQRLLNYIVPDFVHVLSDGPARAVRRPRAGARARRKGLRLARRGGAFERRH